jgi:regulator of protease activity HflC (stomatin/prohibitin superfamily)
MPEKHYVYSSRTTERGLKILNELKDRLGVTWDGLITDAVCAHYKLDRADIALPRDTRREEERAAKEAEKQARAEQREKDRQDKLAKKEADRKAKAEKRAKALKERQERRKAEKKAKAKAAKKTGKKG